MNVHSSIIHNSPQSRNNTHTMFIHTMNEQNVVYPYNGIYSKTERNEVLVHAIKWMSLENIMLRQTSQSQNIMYCLIAFT